MPGERERLAQRRPALEARARVLRAIRGWFEEQGFLEVDTPARVRAPGQEVHLDAFAAGVGMEGDGGGEGRWLITSPEYAMKRLCGAGFERIVSIGKCWRAGERGPHHEPEFTMIEWYRAGEPLARIAEDCQALLRLAAAAGGAAAGAAAAALAAPFARTTVRALMARHAGLTIDGDETAAELAARARAAGVEVGGAAAWEDVFFQVWLDRVEPHLGDAAPTFVFDWPAPLGALARRQSGDPRLAERFELYAGGLELANAFGELTDAEEQRARFTAESAARRRRGKAVYPIDEALLAALAGMPPTSGVALGFDRVMMFVLGAREIRQVMAFAADEI